MFNGLEMTGAKTSWVYPEVLPEGISGPLTPEEAERGFREVPEAAALIVTSPNYYGIRSDIRRLAETAHRWGAILIVDQAHGAQEGDFQKDHQLEVDGIVGPITRAALKSEYEKKKGA